MTRPALALAGLFAAAAATPVLAEPGVSVENAAARMVVIPEARGDVKVEVRAGDPRLPMPAVRRDGDRLIVDGGLRGRVGGCGVIGVDWRVFDGGGQRGEPNPHTQRVMIRGIGPMTLDLLPVITAHVPMRAAVSVDRAVFGKVGPSQSLAFQNSGCGDWRIGDVQEALVAETHGSGDIVAARVGALKVSLTGSGDLNTDDVERGAAISTHGSGDVALGRVGGRLDAEMAGSGDLKAREVLGPIASHQSGSGDVQIRGGRAPSVAVQTSGSGDFQFKGEAGSVSAQSSGSGDIQVAHASGPVSKAHSGSGEIEIGR